MDKKAVDRKEGYEQVCIWPGVELDDTDAKEFEHMFFLQGFNVQYLEQVTTTPDVKNGAPVEGTGGRIDQIFAVSKDDIPKFAGWRLNHGIRWIEDALGDLNEYDKNPIYPEHIKAYKTWET